MGTRIDCTVEHDHASELAVWRIISMSCFVKHLKYMMFLVIIQHSVAPAIAITFGLGWSLSVVPLFELTSLFSEVFLSLV